MIKLDRIENALNKIESQKKDASLNLVKAQLSEAKVAIAENPLTVQCALASLEEVFSKLTELDGEDHTKVFAEFSGSLNEAIQEHIQILTDHAEEILNQQ